MGDVCRARHKLDDLLIRGMLVCADARDVVLVTGSGLKVHRNEPTSVVRLWRFQSTKNSWLLFRSAILTVGENINVLNSFAGILSVMITLNEARSS